MAEAKFTLTAVDQTKAAFDSVKRNLGDVERQASALRSVFAGIGAGLSAGALVGFVRTAIDAADNLGKLSQRVGVTVESLSELQYAGKLADVTTEQLGDKLRKLSVNLQSAAGGSKELQAAFAAVGISTAELGTIKADAALLRIADAFARAEDGAGKTALAVKILGRSGSDFIPFLNAGSAGLKEMGDEARRFGLVVSGEAAKAAETFNDNVTRLTSAAQAFGVSLANVVLPKLTQFTEELLEGQRIFGSFASALYNIGFGIDPFKSIGENIKQARRELEQFQRERANSAAEGNTNLGGFDAKIEQQRKRLEFLLFQQRRDIPTGDPSTFDARDRAAQRQPGRNTLAVPKEATDDKLPDFEAGSRRMAEKFTQIYLDQFDLIRKAKKDLDAELLERFEAGNALDAKVIDEQTAALDRLLSQTKSGRLDTIYKDLERANKAFKDGAISAAQLNDVYKLLAEQIKSVDAEGQDTFSTLAADGSKALRDLQFAVEGWGRQFTNTLATAIETGRLKFSELVSSVLKDLLRLQIQRSITVPLFNALQGAIGGSFGGGGASPAGSPFANPSPRAAGGPVTGGTPYLVGERGPELFVPSGNGSIVANGRLGGPVIQQTVYIDSRSDVNSVREAVYQASALARSEMARDQRRG